MNAPTKDSYALLALAARIVLGLLFAMSGLHKASMPVQEFAVVIEAYHILPPKLIMPLAAVLPWAEALLGLALAAGYFTRVAAAGIGLMLLTFLGALASTLARRVPLESCGCFGGGIHLSRIQAMMLDAGLGLLAALSFWKGRVKASLDNWVEHAS